MRSFVVILLALLTFVLTSKAQKSSDVLKEAKKAFSQKKYAEASTLFSVLLSNESNNPYYNYAYGTCLYHTSRNKAESIKYLKFASGKKGIPIDVYYRLGRALHGDFQFADAKKAYNMFFINAKPKEVESSDVEIRISMCTNAERLMDKSSQIVVLDKQKSKNANFYQRYDAKKMGGKIVLAPNDYKSSLDFKNSNQAVIYTTIGSNVHYYSSYGGRGRKGMEVYRVQRNGLGQWLDPQPVRDYVNTPYDEAYPILNNEGNVFYFSSKGHNSMGGYDIYRCFYDAKLDKFYKPQNMGFPINSPEDDVLFIPSTDGTEATFTTNRNSVNGEWEVVTIKLGPASSKLLSLDELRSMNNLTIASENELAVNVEPKIEEIQVEKKSEAIETIEKFKREKTEVTSPVLETAKEELKEEKVVGENEYSEKTNPQISSELKQEENKVELYKNSVSEIDGKKNRYKELEKDSIKTYEQQIAHQSKESGFREENTLLLSDENIDKQLEDLLSEKGLFEYTSKTNYNSEEASIEAMSILNKLVIIEQTNDYIKELVESDFGMTRRKIKQVEKLKKKVTTLELEVASVVAKIHQLEFEENSNKINALDRPLSNVEDKVRKSERNLRDADDYKFSAEILQKKSNQIRVEVENEKNPYVKNEALKKAYGLEIIGIENQNKSIEKREQVNVDQIVEANNTYIKSKEYRLAQEEKEQQEQGYTPKIDNVRITEKPDVVTKTNLKKFAKSISKFDKLLEKLESGDYNKLNVDGGTSYKQRMPSNVCYIVKLGVYKNTPSEIKLGQNSPIIADQVEAGIFNYIVGTFRTYAAADVIRNGLKDEGFIDATIHAFRNGIEISNDIARKTLVEKGVTVAKTQSEYHKDNDAIFNNFIDNTIDELLTNTVPESKRKEKVKKGNIAKATSLDSIQGLLYTVQIGVFANPATVERLSNIDKLYSKKTSSGYYKYSTGLFEDVNDARAYKEKIVGEGLKDAFVTAYYDGESISLTAINSMKEEQKKSAEFIPKTDNKVQSSSNTISEITENSLKEIKSKQETDNPTKATSLSSIQGLVYTVQIGVFANPATVERLSNVGKLYSKKMSNGHVKYSTGLFEDINDARAYREKVVEKGLKDAFVAAYDNGERVSITATSSIEEGQKKSPALVTKVDKKAEPSSKTLADKVPEPEINISSVSVIPETTEKQQKGNNTKQEILEETNDDVTKYGLYKDLVFSVVLGDFSGDVPINEASIILQAGSAIEKIKLEDKITRYQSVENFKFYLTAKTLKEEYQRKGASSPKILAILKGEEIALDEALKLIKK